MEKFITFLFDKVGSGTFFDAWGGIFNRVRGVAIIIDGILIIAFIILFFAAFRYRPKIHPHIRSRGKKFTLKDDLFKQRWDSVMKRVATGSTDAMKLAIIEADKLADDALRQLGLKGEHMAARLSAIKQGDLKSIDKLWRAHRLRNDLVHTPGFTISSEKTYQALDDFQAFLKEVNVLQ